MLIQFSGNPGCGKSVLAASTVHDMFLDIKSRDPVQSEIVCYYFFSQEDPRSSTALCTYRALLAQLFNQCVYQEEIHSVFSLGLQGASDAVAQNELLDLLSLCLQLLPQTTFILDGLDECSENAKIIGQLKKLRGGTNIKILLFSRPNVACLRQSREISVVSMSRATLSLDIAVCLGITIQTMDDSQLLPHGTDIDACVRRLVERAEGMFLWSRLMVAYLNSPALTPRSRLQAIQDATPDGLVGMFRRIMSLIKSFDKPSQELAATMCTWVAHAQRGLSTMELREAARKPQNTFDEADKLPNFEDAILLSCGGLLERRPDGTIQFIHRTAKDFIFTMEEDPSEVHRFMESRSDAEASLSLHCLHYLMSAVPPQPLAMTTGPAQPRSSITELLPLLKYASSHWCAHFLSALRQSKDTSHDLELLLNTLRRFLALPLTLMVWLEATYTVSGGSNVIDYIRGDVAMVPDLMERVLHLELHSTLKELQEFMKDISAIRDSWDSHLSENPAEIWNDITAFTPSKYLRQTSALSVEAISTGFPDGMTKDNGILFEMSKTSMNMTKLAVLSIWPSR